MENNNLLTFGPGSSLFGRARRFSLVLLAASCLSTPALAQVTPTGSGTTVYTAPNGVPVVDIAKANSAGLSHNKYTNYNVDSKGLVLNNGNYQELSRQSQLAGQVPANMNLTNEASVILNEVVSVNRSALKGYTEVLGRAADVIVANPNGITCNGCGFINTPNVTLTTGIPLLGAGGGLNGFRVDNGDIRIEGNGIDGSKQDYLALVARTVTLDGQVNAKALDVVAGANDWDHNTRTATARAAGGAAPLYAIDSSALGGMYAGRIRLIATEAGVGVRMNNEAAASSGDFTLSASGKIEINNKISAETDINISSTAAGADAVHITNTTVSAKRDTTITASAGEVHLQGGTITANEDMSIASASLNDESTAAAGADNNKRFAGQNMTLNQTGAAAITGTSWTGENFTLTTGAGLTNAGTLSAETGTLTANIGTALTNSSLIQSTGAMSLNIGSTLTNNAGASIIASGNMLVRGLNASAYDIRNHNTIQADGLLDIKGFGAGNAVNIYTSSAAGDYIGGTADINSALLSLLNDTGLTTQGNMTVNTATLSMGGSGSYILAGKSGTGNGTITVANAFTHTGTLFSRGNLTLNTGGFTNSSTGGIGANGTLTINATGNVDNSGDFFAAMLLNISAAGRTVRNLASGFITGTNDITITADVFRNNNDVIAGRDMTITAREIRNEYPGGDTRTLSPTLTYTENGNCSPYDTSRTNCSPYHVNEEKTLGLVYDETHYYHKTWYQDQIYGVIPTAANRPVLAAGTTAGSDLTLQGFNFAHNLGGIISAHHIDLQGNVGASFVNDAYGLDRLTTTIEWDSWCDRDLATDSCDWTMPTVAQPSPRRLVYLYSWSNIDAGPGASIMAHSLTGNNFSLTNIASTYNAAPGSVPAPTGGTGGTITLPTNPNGFFVVSKNPNSKYLVETNPLYGQGSFMSSDYLAERFGIDPETLQRRLGDGAYEAYLIRQQLISQVGSNIIVGGESEAQQMQRLMDQGADQGKALGLEYGKAPTEQQLANLTGDMVWMVETEVNGEKVLAPVVYLSQATKDAITGGAVIMANSIDLDLDSMNNTGGTIQGTETLTVASKGDITNLSGTIRGGDVSLTSTEGSIISRTYASTSGDGLTMQTDIGKTAGIEATGNLSLDAAQDIANIGANMSADGNADLSAGNNIIFDTVEDRRASTTHSQSGGAFDGTTTTTTEATTTHLRSGLTVGGNLTTDSGSDTTFAGTDVTVGGNVDVSAEGNLNILSRDDTRTTSSSTSGSGLGVGGGIYGTETTTTDTFQSRNKGSSFNIGGNAGFEAGETLTIQGSNVDVAGDLGLKGDDINIIEGRDIDRTTTTTTTTTFGKVDMGEGFSADEEEEEPEETERGGVSAKASAEAETGYEDNGGVTFSETTIESTDKYKSTAAGSSIKSGGNMTISAENDVLIRGSDVEAGGNADVSGENVTVTAAQNIETTTTDKTVAKVGLYGSTSNEVGASAEAEAYAAAEGEGSPEAGASAGAQAGASSTNTLDIVRVDQTTRTTNDVTHTGGSIKSGGNTTINAENKLTVHGSSLESGGDMTLEANDMAFTAAIDSHTETLDASHTRAGLYLDAGTSADAGASASAQGMTAGAGASANAGAEAGVGLYGSNTTQGSVSGTTTAQTSSIKSGGNMTRTAENNITDVGTQIEAGSNFTQTSESWDSKAAQNTSFSTSNSESHEARLGLYAEAGAEAQGTADSLQGVDHGAGANASVGISASYSGSTSDKSSSSSEAVVSNIKSGGNMTTTTGKTSLEGTNLESGGDMSLTAGSLDYTAARNTESESEGSANTDASLKIGVDATKAVTGEAAGGYGESSSSSSSSTAVVGGMKSGGNLTIKTTAGDANFEGTNIESDGNASIDASGDVNFNAAHNTSESSETEWNVEAGVSASRNKSKGSKGAGVELSGGYQTSEEESDEAVAGSIKSGGTLNIKSGNNATFEGTDIESGGDATIEAKNDVTFNAAESTSSSSGWGVEASLSGSSGGQRGQNGKTRNREKEAEGGISGGYNESSERTSDVSDISSGGNLKIKSGNDVNLEGTNIEADGKATLDAGNDVNFTAATNTKHSVGFSAGAEGVVTKEGADEDGNGVKYETQKKGKAGFELEGEESVTKTGGSIKAKMIEIFSGNDTNLEGTTTESKGDTTISAGGDVNLKAAESSHIDGGLGVGVGGKSAGLTRASIDAGADQQGVQMKSGNDVNITSGGQTVMEGTQIEADGNANIDAQGGQVHKTTGEAGFNFGMDHAGGELDTQGVSIVEHGEDNSAVGDDSDALKAVFTRINDNGPEGVPPSQDQNDLVNEIENLDYNESLTPEQREQKREILQQKLENQKAIDLVKQDESLTPKEKAKLLKELAAKQKELDEQ